MGLFNVLGGEAGGQAAGAAAMLPYYDNAKALYDPYRTGGLADYDTYRSNVSNMGNMLGQYGNPAAYQWGQAGLSPNEAYQNLMAPYTTSPQAQYQTEQMQKAADRGASASGMLGSGSYFDALQRNQQNIIAEDQDRWLRNQMGVSQQQTGQIQNFQQQQQQYNSMMQYLTQLGFDATAAQAMIEQAKAQPAGMQAQGESNAWGNIINTGIGLAGGFF